MSKTFKYTCDCGNPDCKAETTDVGEANWLILLQKEYRGPINDRPKLDREVHLSSPACGLFFFQKAIPILSELQERHRKGPFQRPQTDERIPVWKV